MWHAVNGPEEVDHLQEVGIERGGGGGGGRGRRGGEGRNDNETLADGGVRFDRIYK